MENQTLEPDTLSSKSSLLPLILLSILLVISLSSSVYLFYQNRQLQDQIVLISKPQISEILNPSPTTAPANDWLSNTATNLSFQYPPDWTVEVKTQYNDQEIIIFNNPQKNVSLKIARVQQSYGFGGDIEKIENPLEITFLNQTVDTTEYIVDSRTAYVDQKVNIAGKEYFIFFGTGYPINQDENASLTQYSKDKATILQILSTFKFTEPENLQPSPKPVSITIPSDWKTYTATDDYYGLSTNLKLPPTLSFRFTGSETVVFSENSSENWDYFSSLIRTEYNQQPRNTYTGGSRRVWYQNFLNGSFGDRVAKATISSVEEKSAGKST